MSVVDSTSFSTLIWYDFGPNVGTTRTKLETVDNEKYYDDKVKSVDKFGVKINKQIKTESITLIPTLVLVV